MPTTATVGTATVRAIRTIPAGINLCSSCSNTNVARQVERDQSIAMNLIDRTTCKIDCTPHIVFASFFVLRFFATEVMLILRSSPPLGGVREPVELPPEYGVREPGELPPESPLQPGLPLRSAEVLGPQAATQHTDREIRGTPGIRLLCDDDSLLEWTKCKVCTTIG